MVDASSHSSDVKPSMQEVDEQCAPELRPTPFSLLSIKFAAPRLEGTSI